MHIIVTHACTFGQKLVVLLEMWHRQFLVRDTNGISDTFCVETNKSSIFSPLCYVSKNGCFLVLSENSICLLVF